MDVLIWLNGELVPAAAAKVGVLDRGVLYGDGIFETMRAYQGRVFRLAQHLDRLARGADALAIKLPLSRQELEAAVTEALVANAVSEASVRLTVTRGEGAGPLPGEAGPIVFILARRFTPYDPELYRKGMSAITASETRNEQSVLAGIKSANYLQSVLARVEADRNGAREAILLNTHGYVAEASTSNVFVLHADAIATPSVESGALPGITRAAVLALAAGAGLAAVERAVTPDELLAADEAFLTNSLMEVMPLTELDGQPIGNGRPGAATRRLVDAYAELVRRETGAA